MAKQLAQQLAFKFLITAILIISHSSCSTSKEVDPWLQHLTNAKPKVSHLHFYLHDTFTGQSPSAVQVVKNNITQKSPTLFGAIVMMDDPLTEGPLLKSKEIGRAQGLYGSSGQTTFNLAMAFNLVFTSGEFNGSTLAILGPNPATQPTRELPVVGGTGAFRLARGFTSLKTYSLNATNGDAIVEYNVSVIHY